MGQYQADNMHMIQKHICRNHAQMYSKSDENYKSKKLNESQTKEKYTKLYQSNHDQIAENQP